jgi:hypothetical protein
MTTLFSHTPHHFSVADGGFMLSDRLSLAAWSLASEVLAALSSRRVDINEPRASPHVNLLHGNFEDFTAW